MRERKFKSFSTKYYEICLICKTRANYPTLDPKNLTGHICQVCNPNLKELTRDNMSRKG